MSDPTKTARTLANPVLLWELVQTSHLASRAFRELFTQFDLTPTQFGVLSCLADGDDFTKAELARALLIRPQSMDPLIESLLEQGLVRRDGPARRGRAAGVAITPAGTVRLAHVAPRVAELNRPERLGLAEDQIEVVNQHLQTIRNRLEDG